MIERPGEPRGRKWGLNALPYVGVPSLIAALCRATCGPIDPHRSAAAGRRRVECVCETLSLNVSDSVSRASPSITQHASRINQHARHRNSQKCAQLHTGYAQRIQGTQLLRQATGRTSNYWNSITIHGATPPVRAVERVASGTRHIRAALEGVARRACSSRSRASATRRLRAGAPDERAPQRNVVEVDRLPTVSTYSVRSVDGGPGARMNALWTVLYNTPISVWRPRRRSGEKPTQSDQYATLHRIVSLHSACEARLRCRKARVPGASSGRAAPAGGALENGGELLESGDPLPRAPRALRRPSHAMRHDRPGRRDGEGGGHLAWISPLRRDSPLIVCCGS